MLCVSEISGHLLPFTSHKEVAEGPLKTASHDTGALWHDATVCAKKVRINGFWAWHQIAQALRDAGILVQSGTVPVERFWSILHRMLPTVRRCITLKWFKFLSRIAFIRYNLRHFQEGSTAPWAHSDVCHKRLDLFENCACLF